MSGTLGYDDIRAGTVRQVAQLMAAAAITAPKSGGQLFLAGKPNFMETVIADDPGTRGDLAAWMRARGKERRERIWFRDAPMVQASAKAPPAMLAALWTVSNGRCCTPGCIMPVVLEVRPGVYQKKSQVAHIYGVVRPGAPRYRSDMPAGERDPFANLLLLCTAHHEEVDGKDGEDRYPPETLRRWKAQHEGAAGSVLKNLTVPCTDALMRKLIEIAEPPLERLETITLRLEETGTPTSLATRNLLRNLTMEVPSGQSIANAMSLPPLAEGDLSDLQPLNLHNRTPLWFYILREAQVTANGEHLGPVGGRIVAEVIHGLIEGDSLSYLGQDPEWTPTYGTNGTFTIVDLLTRSGTVATLT